MVTAATLPDAGRVEVLWTSTLLRIANLECSNSVVYAIRSERRSTICSPQWSICDASIVLRCQTIEFELGIWRRRPDLNRGWRFCRFNRVVDRVVSCWSLVSPAPRFAWCLGTIGLHLDYDMPFGVCALRVQDPLEGLRFSSLDRLRCRSGVKTPDPSGLRSDFGGNVCVANRRRLNIGEAHQSATGRQPHCMRSRAERGGRTPVCSLSLTQIPLLSASSSGAIASAPDERGTRWKGGWARWCSLLC